MLYLCLLLIILFYYYFTRNHNYWNKRHVKHDKPTPIFGNALPILLGKRNVTGVSLEMYKKYPNEKIVGLYRGAVPELVIRDPEIIKRILTVDFANFYSRGLGRDTSIEPLLLNLGFADGDLWKLLRQHLTPAFTSAKLKAMFPLVVQCAEKLQTVAESIADKGGDCDVRELMARYTIDFIGACGFGIEMNTMSSELSLFRDFGRLIFTPTWRNHTLVALWDLLPAFRGVIQKWFAEQHILEIATEILVSVQKQRNYKPIGRNDFVDLLLELRGQGKIVGDSIEKKDRDGKPAQVEMEMDVQCMAAQMTIFFAAGYETSASATSYLLYELAFHLKEQEEVQQDIDRVLAKYDNKLCFDAVSEMTLLNLGFKEALRIFPSVGTLFRQCVKKYTIPELGITIDQGVKILIPVQALHMEEKYFENPTKFELRRFANISAESLNAVYLPYGGGPRSCIACLQRLGYRVDLVPVEFYDYCLLEMCGHEIFRCNIRNLRFNTHHSLDVVCERAVQAVLDATGKFQRARDYLWFMMLLELRLHGVTHNHPGDYWPVPPTFKKAERTTCTDCSVCCGKPQPELEFRKEGNDIRLEYKKI